MANLSEREGISVWRQIGDALLRDIESGTYQAESRLPPSVELAQRFGVNRHTVLRAISHLQAEGVVRIERGRGTYVVVNRLEYRLGPRRWFEQNLLDSGKVPTRTVLAVTELEADAPVAVALSIRKGAVVVFVKTMGEADGFPVNFGCHYFPAKRLPGIAEAFRQFGDRPTAKLSFAEIFRSIGVSGYRRRTIRIRSRLPSQEESWRLRMPQSEHVLETEVTSVDSADRPVTHALTCFCSGRVELIMDV